MPWFEGGWQLCCGGDVGGPRRKGCFECWTVQTGTMQGGYVCRIARPNLKPSDLYISMYWIGPRNTPRASMMDVTKPPRPHTTPAPPSPNLASSHTLPAARPPHFTRAFRHACAASSQTPIPILNRKTTKRKLRQRCYSPR